MEKLPVIEKFRQPDADERQLIAKFISRHKGDNVTQEEIEEDYLSSTVTCLNYIPDGPGFCATLVFISYGGAIEYFETACIKNGICKPLRQAEEFRPADAPEGENPLL